MPKLHSCKWFKLFYSFGQVYTSGWYRKWGAGPKYEGMDEKEAKKLKELEDENRKLREIVADLSLDNQALKEVIKKKL